MRTTIVENQANSLGSDFVVNGNLFSASDIDYFSIAATGAGTISINFDPTVNSSWQNYYTVSLLDSAGTILASQTSAKTLTSACRNIMNHYLWPRKHSWCGNGEVNSSPEQQSRASSLMPQTLITFLSPQQAQAQFPSISILRAGRRPRH